MSNVPIRKIARLICRNELVGIIFPLSGDVPSKQLDGIYEIVETLGELQIVRIGDPAMPRKRLRAVDLQGLLDDRSLSALTAKELDAILKSERSSKDEN